MDLSAVIFVAVAVAWAVYLVPKALRAHDEADRSRSVERFSHTVRVLARRDAVSARDARLVVPQPSRRAAGHAPQDDVRDSSVAPDTAPEAAPAPPPTAAQIRARRQAARRATQRRRRVLGLLLTANIVVGTLVGFSVLALGWQAIPAGLLVAWLAACRLMVRGERAAWSDLTAPTAAPQAPEAEREPEPSQVPAAGSERETGDEGAVPDVEEAEADADTADHDVVPARAPLWDPVPMTLPTYVHKATAVRRSVRTIDLDATGVWTSGRTDEDARIAQATAKRVVREAGGEGEKAVGS